MKLVDYLVAKREPILSEWEEFARSCAPASGTMDVEALRDHADQMLTAIAADLGSAPGDRGRQRSADPGVSPAVGEQATAAGKHGADRAESGFSIEQMVAEYRALRASVLRLWAQDKEVITKADLEDLARFNEALDQALSESVAEFNRELEQSEELFLAILGHDLRTPLGAILTTAQLMLEMGDLPQKQLSLTQRVASAAGRTVKMVGDLLDFTRGRLGGGIPVFREETDLTPLVAAVAEEIRAAHPHARIDLDLQGDLVGEWDAARLAQALSNLIGNAIQHGARGTPASVTLRSTADHVTIAIHNQGAGGQPLDVDGIFNPMRAKGVASAAGPTASLGLGLYIAQLIISAHEGRITAESSEAAGVTFTVHLPRHPTR